MFQFQYELLCQQYRKKKLLYTSSSMSKKTKHVRQLDKQKDNIHYIFRFHLGRFNGFVIVNVFVGVSCFYQNTIE